MQYKKVKEMQSADLSSKLLELRQELIKLNGSVATGTAPKNPGQVRTTKKSIAKILTEIKKREVQING